MPAIPKTRQKCKYTGEGKRSSVCPVKDFTQFAFLALCPRTPERALRETGILEAWAVSTRGGQDQPSSSTCGLM